MRRAFASALLVAFIAGCGAPARQASSLQRLDQLGPALHTATADATRVSKDWSRLASLVSRAHASGVRIEARRLAADGRRLSRKASADATDIQRLSRAPSRGIIPRYFNDLVLALSAERWEGREAGWTAGLVEADPFLEDGNDAARLAYLSTLTRRSARRAVGFTRASLRLRRTYPRQFRYVPASPRKP